VSERKSMSDRRSGETVGSDWTHLLADPDLVKHMGRLLQTYREAPPETREEALLAAMREIKSAAASASSQSESVAEPTETQTPSLPTPSTQVPPFEPDMFAKESGDDRRSHPRMKCFVAVEIRVEGSATPLWGNLANTSMGGCFIEISSAIPSGKKLEIGLWVANGKIWVKGLILDGIATRQTSRAGLRVKFSQMEPAEKQNLREFLRYVQDATRALRSEKNYLSMLK
jgi:PilZ domain